MRILNVKRVDKNTLRAVFDLQLSSGVIIHGAMLHSRDGREWIAMPGKPYESGGKQCWANLISFADKEIEKAFQRAALAAIKEAVDGE